MAQLSNVQKIRIWVARCVWARSPAGWSQVRGQAIYGADEISERHRHRYEVNSNYVSRLEKAGMKMSGWSLDGELVEIIELPAHPWFVACQFHPEFKSRPRGGHPLFNSYIQAALAASRQCGDAA